MKRTANDATECKHCDTSLCLGASKIEVVAIP